MSGCYIVTGAASGIGAACVQVLLAQGKSVLGVDRTPIVDTHPMLQTLQLDITESHAAATVCTTACTWAGHIVGFVHAAGVNQLCHPFAVDEAHWDKVMGVNAKATWFMTSAVLQHMVSRNAGSVVLIASIAGKMASTIQHPVYNVSKAAVIAMTKTFAQTVAAAGVRINCVCPGVIDTPMQHHVTQSMVDATHSYAQITQQRIAKVPLGHMGEPRDVADMVAFLLSEQARYVHGQAMNVDGGILSY